MATANPFGLLGDDDNEDPSVLAAAQQKLPPSQPKKPQAPAAAAAQPAKPAKLPSKPLPPAQAGETPIRIVIGLELCLFAEKKWKKRFVSFGFILFVLYRFSILSLRFLLLVLELTLKS